MKLRALIVFVLLIGLLPSVASADGSRGLKFGTSINLASGVAVVGAADPNVTVIPPGGRSQAALLCSDIPGAWAAALPDTNWISIQADCSAGLAAGDYQYSASFSLSSNAGPLRLRGSVTADDSVTVQLNGHTIFSGGGFTAASSFSSDDASLFNTGTNTLTFVVNNGDGPTGLDFVVNVSAGETVGAEKNHGQCVSAVAHQTARGRGHGKAVSEAARFACGGEDE